MKKQVAERQQACVLAYRDVRESAPKPKLKESIPAIESVKVFEQISVLREISSDHEITPHSVKILNYSLIFITWAFTKSLSYENQVYLNIDPYLSSRLSIRSIL